MVLAQLKIVCSFYFGLYAQAFNRCCYLCVSPISVSFDEIKLFRSESSDPPKCSPPCPLLPPLCVPPFTIDPPSRCLVGLRPCCAARTEANPHASPFPAPLGQDYRLHQDPPRSSATPCFLARTLSPLAPARPFPKRSSERRLPPSPACDHSAPATPALEPPNRASPRPGWTLACMTFAATPLQSMIFAVIGSVRRDIGDPKLLRRLL